MTYLPTYFIYFTLLHSITSVFQTSSSQLSCQVVNKVDLECDTLYSTVGM